MNFYPWENWTSIHKTAPSVGGEECSWRKSELNFNVSKIAEIQSQDVGMNKSSEASAWNSQSN